jgi:UrcA family protein
MRTLRLRVVPWLVSCAIIGSVTAQTPPEVVVTSSRMLPAGAGTMAAETGTMPGGTPIVAVSLSYTVSGKGLDLTSQDGRAKFEKAVSDAAWKACQAIHNQFPETSPSLNECAQQAKDKAMPQVRDLEAKAGKGATGK